MCKIHKTGVKNMSKDENRNDNTKRQDENVKKQDNKSNQNSRQPKK